MTAAVKKRSFKRSLKMLSKFLKQFKERLKNQDLSLTYYNIFFFKGKTGLTFLKYQLFL